MKVVIFDMDGTVVDSSKAIERTINEVRGEMGLDELDTQTILQTINTPGKNLAYEFYGLKNPSGSFKEGFEDKFKINYDLYASAYPGVEELLQNCREAGFKLALASNAPAKTLEGILKRNEIFDSFDYIIGADEKIPPKPDPTMLFVVKDELGCDEAIFVGDSLKDEEAAVNAKMPYVHVSWGFGTAKEPSSKVANDAGELFEILKAL